MLFSYQLDVIEDVIDVVADRLDVDTVPIAHSMTNCVDSQQKSRRKPLLNYVRSHTRRYTNQRRTSPENHTPSFERKKKKRVGEYAACS